MASGHLFRTQDKHAFMLYNGFRVENDSFAIWSNKDVEIVAIIFGGMKERTTALKRAETPRLRNHCQVIPQLRHNPSPFLTSKAEISPSTALPDFNLLIATDLDLSLLLITNKRYSRRIKFISINCCSLTNVGSWSKHSCLTVDFMRLWISLKKSWMRLTTPDF